MESQGYYAPVYNLAITYKKPVRLGDRAFVKTWVEVCAEGTTTHIVVKKENGEFKPVQFRKAFPEWYQKYEEMKRR